MVNSFGDNTIFMFKNRIELQNYQKEKFLREFEDYKLNSTKEKPLFDLKSEFKKKAEHHTLSDNNETNEIIKRCLENLDNNSCDILFFSKNKEIGSCNLNDKKEDFAEAIYRVARAYYGLQVDYLGPTLDMQEALVVANNGVSVMMIDGNSSMLVLSKEIDEDTINNIINTLDKSDSSIYYVVFNNGEYKGPIVASQVIEILNNYSNNEEYEKISVNDYIDSLIEHLKTKKVNIVEYYKEVAKKYINNEYLDLDDFELRNPFLSSEDIDSLINSTNNEKDIGYFANSITRIVELYLRSRVIKNNNIIKNIDFDILDNIDGYAVLTDDDTINLYVYNCNDKSSLTGRNIYSTEKFNITSGYYLNINQFMEKLLGEINKNSVLFIGKDGVEYDYDAMNKVAKEYCDARGAIKMQSADGVVLDDLFANKDDIVRLFKNYKIKIMSNKYQNRPVKRV